MKQVKHNYELSFYLRFDKKYHFTRGKCLVGEKFFVGEFFPGEDADYRRQFVKEKKTPWFILTDPLDLNTRNYVYIFYLALFRNVTIYMLP